MRSRRESFVADLGTREPSGGGVLSFRAVVLTLTALASGSIELTSRPFVARREFGATRDSVAQHRAEAGGEARVAGVRPPKKSGAFQRA